MIARPQPDEYAELYSPHVKRIPEGADILAILAAQPDELRSLLQHVSDEQANARPAAGEWSIKEVVGHVSDTDRIYTDRILRTVRGEKSPLMSFNPPAYVEAADFNRYRLGDLVEEFALHRAADMRLFRALTEAELMRQGTALEHVITARAILFIMAGHVMHHMESLKTTYQVKSGA